MTSGEYIYFPSLEYEKIIEKFGEIKRCDLFVIDDRLIIRPNPKGSHSIATSGTHILSAKISCKKFNKFFRFEGKRKYKLFEEDDYYYIREDYFL